MNELTNGYTLQHGKYKIVKPLGRGSFGITYLATTNVALSGGLGNIDVTVNVAIKEFFMDGFNSRSIDRRSVDGTRVPFVKKYLKKFHQEAENLGKLKHPNIVRVLEVFDENNTTYYAMEYIEGESLDEYIRNKGRIPESEVLIQLQEIGAALKHMHDHKMLHLDLKPKNIMRNRVGHLFLIDFGLSKQYDQNGEPESSTTLGLGTPGYAPIEQANYKHDGSFPATLDIYALGASIYKMLIGTTPPRASDILSEGFPDILFVERRISEATIVIVKKAMSPIKEQRYNTVSELLEDIDSKKSHANSSKNGGCSSFKKVVGTEEVINIDVDDPLPMPDSGICISLSNPASGSLSYRFYFSEVICNTVSIYRDGQTILDENYAGGIRPEIIEALKQNGFFSKVHWEQEFTTVPLGCGIVVSCSFFYKNGDKFVREVKYVTPTHHHLLLDAVNNVAKVGELSIWVYEALNREHKYSHEDIEQYGISVFSFTANCEMSIYYRGYTYSGDEIGAYSLKSFYGINETFERIKYNLKKKSTQQIDFDSYLRNNKEIIAKSFNIITYCDESDLLKLLYNLRKNPLAYGNYRIEQEMRLLPLCLGYHDDSIVGYEYQQNLYCEVEFGGGIVEILQAGFEDTKDIYSTDTTVKKLSNFESFAYLVLSSIVNYQILNKDKDWEFEGLLLSSMPFEIKGEVWINDICLERFILIDRNVFFPTSHYETIATNNNNCTIIISFLGKRFSIGVNELFRYCPKTIKLTVEIGTNIVEIKYIIKDEEMGKEIYISQLELFNYEVKADDENGTQ